ncbi:Vegetative incompatibility protein HET-E-1, partial [Pseudocercospora fuligena]
ALRKEVTSSGPACFPQDRGEQCASTDEVHDTLLAVWHCTQKVMRLIETASYPGSLNLCEFAGSNIPKYAILSHTWSDDEVLYKDNPLAQSRWFTRGWTLQELVAPQRVVFLSRQWVYLGELDKRSFPNQALFLKTVSIASRVAMSVLTGTVDLYSVSVAARMSWMAGRETTRAEDMAYCLLGLFGVNMPLLYGEGYRAFARLQEEIMKSTDDNSLFAWQIPGIVGRQRLHGLLASSPLCFDKARSIERNLTMQDSSLELSPYLMTNKGLQIELPLKELVGDIYVAILNCDYGDQRGWVAIYLKRLAPQGNQFARVFADQLTSVHWRERATPERLYVRQESPSFDWSQIPQRTPRTTYWIALDSISITSGAKSVTYGKTEIESEKLVDVWPFVPNDWSSSYLHNSSKRPNAKAHKLNAGMNSVAMLIRCNDLWSQLILILGPLTETFFGYDIILADQQDCSRFAARESILFDELNGEKQLHLPWDQIGFGPRMVQIQIVDVQLATVRSEGTTLSRATDRPGTPRLRPPLLRSNAHDSSFYESRRDGINYEKHFKIRLVIND